MALLKKSYNVSNTERAEIRSVEKTPTPFGHKILKNTDSDLPIGVAWKDSDSNLLKGVWSDEEGTLYAQIITHTTTIDQVKESKITDLNQSAESAIKNLSELDDQKAEKRQAIIDELNVKLAEVESATTIQEVE